MPSSPLLKALGLNRSPNPLEVPQGSLTEASNIIIKRDDIIESRRGYKIYDTGFGTSTDRAKQLAVYKNKILVHYANSLAFDTGQTDSNNLAILNNFSGTFTEPQTGLRIKSIESNGNFYFTSSDGIKKISAQTSNDFTTAPGYVTQAGGVKAVDFTAEAIYQQGNIQGFLTQDSAVAYRTVWGITDKNNNLILGTPSQRVEVFNSLLTILLQDFLKVLGALDEINQSGSMIDNGNYVSTLKLPLNSSAIQLQTNLLNLSTKIDQDIRYANDTGTGVPLTISSAVVTGGICVVTFTTTNVLNYLQVGDKINLVGFGTVTINGTQTVSSATSNSISFNTSSANGTATITGAYIESYNFRNIPQPSVPTTPTTNGQLVALQTYLQKIITELKGQLTGVISSPLQTQFIQPLSITTSSNVRLTITIPQDINSNYFLQVYRTAVDSASSTQVLATDIAPGDEMQLVYEAFPTAAELAASQLTFIDITPDSFRGANLYTNAATGDGILQANDIPPFAKDINRFKNVIFYANTRIKHTDNINLLGVSNMISDYNNGNIPELTIANQNGTFNTYRFIVGQEQITSITTTAGTSLSGKYFTINSANDVDLYYVWFNTGASTDPAVSGRVGIQVPILSGDSNTTVASKLANVLSLFPTDFNVSVSSNIVTVTNVDPGYTGAPSNETSGFSISVTTNGIGEKVTQEISSVQCVADVAGSLAGKYFTLNTAFDQKQYYIWYKVSGSGSDPSITGKTGIQVNLTTNDSANTVALNTGLAIQNFFNVVVASSLLTITNLNYGPCQDVTAGTSGFTVSVTQKGLLDVLLSDAISPSQAVDQTARSLVRIINKNKTENVYGYYLSGSQDVPGKMQIEARKLNTLPFYFLTNNSNTGKSFNPDLSSTLTITSISTGSPSTMVITTSSPHGLINKDNVVISGTNSIPTIDGYYEITYLSPTTFSINVSVTTSGNKGSVIKSTNAEVTNNDDRPNRVYYSKLNQPEAVPSLNFFDVGAMDKAILRIFPLRDTLFILKEDGLFRISGEESPFTLSLFDSSCILLAPDSVSVANNVIYGWTTQGISGITESGVSTPPISRPIDTDILKVASSSYTNFNTATWGIGYDSDNSYTVYTVQQTSDQVATIAYRYSNLTNTWTTYDLSKTCGVINFFDGRMYLGTSDVNSIEQERKNFDRTDYADREFYFTLSSGNYFGSDIKLSNVSNISAGDSITQVQTLTPYTYNMFLKKADLDPGFSYKNYFSTLESFGGDDMRNKLTSLTSKLDTDPNLGINTFSSTIGNKTGSISSISASNPTIITSASHGLLTGRIINISGSNSSPSINGIYQVTVIDSNTFSINVSVISPGTSGSWSTQNEDFRDIQTCYNKVISLINNSSNASFRNYTQITTTTLVEAVVLNVNPLTKDVSLNLSLDFVLGPLTSYKSIKTKFTYSPNHFQNPLTFKHFREFTIMFLNKAFTNAVARIGTDLLPQLIDVPFNGDGNGLFGYAPFGNQFFGGNSSPAPFRTYVPRQCQRCRYIVLQFEHNVAREQFGITGVTLTGDEYSTRAYR